MNSQVKKEGGKVFIIIAWILIFITLMALENNISEWDTISSMELYLHNIINNQLKQSPIVATVSIISVLIGYNILLIIAFVLGLICLIRYRKGKVIIWTSASCVIIMSFLLLLKSNKAGDMIENENKNTVNKLSSDFRKALSGEILLDKEIDHQTYGQSKTIIKFINEYWFEGQEYIKEMNVKILSYDISDIFTAEALTNPSRVLQIKLNIGAITSVCREYEKKLILLSDEFLERFNELNYFSDNTKQEFINIHKKAMADDLEYFNIMENYMSELDIFLDFIKSKQSQMKMKDSKIFFDLQEDSNTYKTYIYKLMYLSNEENKWRNEFHIKQNRIMKELESIAENPSH